MHWKFSPLSTSAADRQFSQLKALSSILQHGRIQFVLQIVLNLDNYMLEFGQIHVNIWTNIIYIRSFSHVPLEAILPSLMPSPPFKQHATIVFK